MKECIPKAAILITLIELHFLSVFSNNLFEHSHKKKTLVRKRTIPHYSELIVLVFTRVQTSKCSKTNFNLAWNGWKETDFSYFLGYFEWYCKWFLSKRSENLLPKEYWLKLVILLRKQQQRHSETSVSKTALFVKFSIFLSLFFYCM